MYVHTRTTYVRVVLNLPVHWTQFFGPAPHCTAVRTSVPMSDVTRMRGGHNQPTTAFIDRSCGGWSVAAVTVYMTTDDRQIRVDIETANPP
jgi:hypothetical protein